MADPFLDALGVADPTTPKATSGPAKTYDPVDAAVRTAMTEESDPTARQWVAGVISNRAKAGKKSVGDVVQEPGQFEPWMTPAGRAKIDAIDPNSDDYKATRAQIEPILNGTSDPTGGATHFYAPDAQAKLGRNKPDFDDGNGTKIGQTLFFGGKVPAGSAGGADPFLTALGVDGSKADAVTPESVEPADMHPTVPVPKLTPAQQKTYATFAKGGYIKDDKAEGTAEAPFWETAENPASHAPAGSYFVDVKGKLQRAPGGPQDSSALAGLGQGAADVVTSLSHVMPGTDDSQIKNRLIADQMKYGAQYGGDLKSGIGRFTGQLAASAPLLAAGGAALEPALAGAGPVGEFLAGKAGGNLLTKGASLATAGAGTGASQAALTASANEGSLGKQMAEGAAGGAALGPLLPAARGAGKWLGETAASFVDPLTQAGRGKIANRIVGKVAGDTPLASTGPEIVPGSVPTLGQASENAGVAALERNARTNPRIAQKFMDRDAQNSAARSDLFEKLRGDENTISDMETIRDATTGGARTAALKAQTQPADITPALSKIDDILKGPEGKRAEVVKALNEVRDNLHDASGNPETSAEMLYGVRKGIGDLLDPKASSDKRGAQLATSQLMAVKGELDSAIQKVAPGFKEYLADYSAMSKPIDEQKYLQSLKMTDARGNITLARVQSALDRIQTQKGANGSNKAKSISDSTLEDLKSLRDDLKRAGNIDLGKARGSDTAQNLVMGNVASKAGVPLGVAAAFAHHPVIGAALGAGKLFYGMKQDQVLDALGSRLLNPEVTAPLVRQPGKVGGAVKRLTAPLLPATGGVLANRLLSAQPQ